MGTGSGNAPYLVFHYLKDEREGGLRQGVLILLGCLNVCEYNQYEKKGERDNMFEERKLNVLNMNETGLKVKKKNSLELSSEQSVRNW